MITLKAGLELRVGFEISSDRLEVALNAAAAGIADLVKELIRNVFRNLNFPLDEPVIEDIQHGSLIVKLRFLTPSSFLQFYDDYKSGKLKKSLADEILKFDESLPVKSNESLEKLKNLRLDDNLTVKIRDEEKVKNHAEKLRENTVESAERGTGVEQSKLKSCLPEKLSTFVSRDAEVRRDPVGEMDKEFSVELLRKFCRNEEVEDEYLRKLANLCGHVPLALRIAASRIHEFEDPAELISWFEKQSSERNQYDQNAIEMSFERLKDEDKKSFVRLAVFGGDFNRDAAKEIIERDPHQTQDFLKHLVDLSLMQRPADGRFLIHSLIRKFLTDYDQLQDERPAAKELMVKHFLKLCQSWTEKHCSKDGFIDARELLKKDAHNVEEMLNVYQGVNLEQSIVESLLCSDIYKSLSRFFYNFVRCIFTETVVRNFLQFCVDLAKREKQLALQINFQCLLSDEEDRNPSSKSSEEYIGMVEKIKVGFDTNKEKLKDDSAICSHFYYCYGRCLLSRHKSTSSKKKSSDLLKKAKENLEESLRLRESGEGSPGERADREITLCQLGLVSRHLARSDKETYERYMTDAQNCYNQALELAKKLLGDHEITYTCYKVLGCLFREWKKYENALEYYKDAKDMYKKLGLDSSESLAKFLVRYALCYICLDRYPEAKAQLIEARNIVDKPAEGDTYWRAQVYFNLAQCFQFPPHGSWRRDTRELQEAAEYAGVALELKEDLKKWQKERMEKIISKSKKYSD